MTMCVMSVARRPCTVGKKFRNFSIELHYIACRIVYNSYVDNIIVQLHTSEIVYGNLYSMPSPYVKVAPSITNAITLTEVITYNHRGYEYSLSHNLCHGSIHYFHLELYLYGNPQRSSLSKLNEYICILNCLMLSMYSTSSILEFILQCNIQLYSYAHQCMGKRMRYKCAACYSGIHSRIQLTTVTQTTSRVLPIFATLLLVLGG